MLAHLGLRSPCPDASMEARKGEPPDQTSMFTYRSCFPAADGTGHLVIALAAASNDLRQATASVEATSGFAQLAALRQLLRLLSDVQVLFEQSATDPTIERFIEQVAVDCRGTLSSSSADAAALVAMLRGEPGAGEAKMRHALGAARNWPSGYPTPNDPAFVEALRELAGVTGRSRGDEGRAEFADEVTARIAFPFPESVTEERVTQLLEGAAHAATAMIDVAGVAVERWLRSRDQ